MQAIWNCVHRAVHFICKDMDVPQQTANEWWQNWSHTIARNWTEHLSKSIKINDTAINCVPLLRDLGVTLDSSLSFNQHVMNTCRSAFLELRHIGLIRKYLTSYCECHKENCVFSSSLKIWLLYQHPVRVTQMSYSKTPESSKYSCTDYTKDGKN